MLKSLGLASSPLLAAALIASGCGETASKSASVTTTTAAAPATTATATTTPPTTTTAPTTAPTPPKLVEESAQKTKTQQTPQQTHEIAEHITENVKKALAKAKAEGKKIKPYKPLEAPGVPSNKRFPTEVQQRFITKCTGNGGGKTSCECLLAKFELSKAEMGQAIAELLYMETVVREHNPLPRRIQLFVTQCHATAV